MALLGPGSVAAPDPLVRTRLTSWSGAKQMARFTKRIITQKIYWVKLAHSPFPHSPSTPVGSINLALGSFCRPARQRSSPLLAHGQNDLQRRAFDPSPPNHYSRNLSPRKILSPLQSGKSPCQSGQQNHKKMVRANWTSCSGKN